MRNKNIARILRGDGGNPRSEQKRDAQGHIIYYMFRVCVFYTNFRNGDARCKGPSLLAKTTPESEGEEKSAENISQRHTAKWPSVVDEVNYWFKHTFPDNVTLNHSHTKCNEIKKQNRMNRKTCPGKMQMSTSPFRKCCENRISDLWDLGFYSTGRDLFLP